MITEVITAQYGQFPLNHNNSLTTLINPATAPVFYDSNGGSKFQRGDNFTIMSIGISTSPIVPLTTSDQFSHIGTPIVVALRWSTDEQNPFANIQIPFAQYEMSLGQYFTAPTAAVGQLEANFTKSHISACTGLVSSIYDGLTCVISVFMKIQHNVALSI